VNLPIRLRIAIAYAALLAVVVAAIGAFLVLRLRADLVGGVDSGLRPATAQIATDYRKEGVPEFRDSASTVLKGERATAQLLDGRGRVVAAFGDRVSATPMVAADAGDSALTRDLGHPAQAFRLATLPVVRDGQRQLVVAGESLAPVERSTRRVVTLLLVAFPVALLLTAAGAWWLARRALRPVEAIASTAASIGVEKLDERVPEPAVRDELWHLARTFNGMLDRIRAGVQEQRRLVADASHELRTPLAAMRAEIDVSLRADDLSPAAAAVLESAREEVDRLSRMVDDLLVLATADEEGGLRLHLAPTDLAVLAARAADELRGHGVELELRGPAAPVLGDERRLERAIRNVVENAVEFSPPGGVVVLETAPGRLSVTDEGPGIPPELRERVFERFFRADPSRTRATGGSGLGLSIAAEIVAAHAGTIRVEGSNTVVIQLEPAFNVASGAPTYGAVP
jgi:two-component system OmpR family sensor kinase